MPTRRFGLGRLGFADPAELSLTGRKISSHLWQAIRTFWPAFAAAASISWSTAQLAPQDGHLWISLSGAARIRVTALPPH